MAHRLQVVCGHLQSKGNSVKVTDCSVQATMSQQKSPITTHVLDTALGRAARGVPVELSYSSSDSTNWVLLASGCTNEDGRCTDLISPGQLKPGTYKMHFNTKSYFALQNNFKPFYPYAEVMTAHNHFSNFYIIKPGDKQAYLKIEGEGCYKLEGPSNEVCPQMFRPIVLPLPVHCSSITVTLWTNLDTKVVFYLENTSQHYHIPLLLSPYAYSTYRGT